MQAVRAQFPDEVVTHAHVRHLDLPGGAGTLALITLDNGFDHTKPTTFGPGGLLELNDALDQVARPDRPGRGRRHRQAVHLRRRRRPQGVAVLRDHDQAKAIGKLGHDVFRRLGELHDPVFAFFNGAAMGGGVEVALHCTYRTVSAGVPAVALPECFLGLVPGWGGTYLLPRLIGPAKALTVIVENAAQPEPAAARPAGVRAGHRRRDVRARPTSWSSRCAGPGGC